jgi:hypothetical protein
MDWDGDMEMDDVSNLKDADHVAVSLALKQTFKRLLLTRTTSAGNPFL